ncbi:hypothetical protein Glove_311g29 [Diversispora epigaea]|uniref:Uncharacterized protein n=1 Tax=Diversispora epigaea TaxID=1348612 RepID=A0A397HXE4_9GLOM|nr:hypothetical protein Glove_311g29 [Diversispora epigaea]
MASNKVHANYISAETRDIDRKEVQDSVFIGMASSGRMPLIEKCYESRIILLLIIAPSWILLYSAIPVIFKFPQGIGADIYRYIEPIVTIPINYFILISAEVFTGFNSEGATIVFNILERSFLNVWFLFGAVIYSQGSGMRLTATMVNQNLDNMIDANFNITTEYPAIEDNNHYQEELGNIFGNYLQIAGAILITWSQIFAYRRQHHYTIHSPFLVIGWLVGGLLNGLLLAATAIEIRQGPLVGLIYVIVMGILLAICLRYNKVLFSRGKGLVLQSYLISYIVGLILIIIWIIVVRGFKDTKNAGLFT